MKTINAVIPAKSKMNASISRCSGINLSFSQSKGTNNYEALTNKPHIEGRELSGDKSFEELGLHPMTNLEIKKIFNQVFNKGGN